ncbi:MAG: hypothetical protein E6Q36_09375 [Chryseobacterium sp.]|nr:MAG: hypothetical protein E6Q36_09375 [Chryseobacterium sp.]
MKLWLLIVGLIISIVCQVFFLQGWQSESVVGNFLLAYLVVVCLYGSKEQMLWMALVAGLMSDLYSNLDFGFYLGFYLLLVIVCKYLLKFGETELSWWRPLVVIAIAASLQAILVSLPVIAQNPGWVLAQNLALFVSLSVAGGVIWYLILNQASEITKKLPKMAR